MSVGGQPLMQAFIINLASAPERWRFVQQIFSGSPLELVRVEAVDGSALAFPIRGYSERLYRFFHGRTTNPREVGCYLSHVRACELFLASGEEHGLICEDDLTLSEGFDEVIAGLLAVSGGWDIARLTGLRENSGVRAIRLSPTHWIRVHLGRLKGAGAYLINRAAARSIVQKLLPMRLPYDHAMDREWCYGMRTVSVSPFPASQVESKFPTSIQRGSMRKLSWLRRCASTYPYQVVNEVSRWIFRAIQLLRLRAGLYRRSTRALQ